MKYARFELLAVGVGAAAVIGTIAIALGSRPDWIEIAAQALVLVALVGAVHWGRKGGMIGALAATLAYLLLRLPGIMTSGLQPEVIELVLIRAATYGFIGVVGGETCGRIKYFFMRMEDSLSIDEHSRVYNQTYVRRMLENSLAAAARYGTRFSVVVLELRPRLTAELRASRQRSFVRAVANHVRNDVRLIDEVGRLDDGRFVVLFPHTPKEGAQIAAERVRQGVRDLVGAKDDSVTTAVFGSDDDGEAISALAASLGVAAGQAASGS